MAAKDRWADLDRAIRHSADYSALAPLRLADTGTGSGFGSSGGRKFVILDRTIPEATWNYNASDPHPEDTLSTMPYLFHARERVPQSDGKLKLVQAVSIDGTLTERTSNSVGEITLPSDHHYLETDIIPGIYWLDSGVWKKRLNVRVGVIDPDFPNVLPISLGTGDNLPADESDIQVRDFQRVQVLHALSHEVTIVTGDMFEAYTTKDDDGNQILDIMSCKNVSPSSYPSLPLPPIEGVLTTRTDNDTGVVTVDSGHGSSSGEDVDVIWTAGERIGMSVTATTSTTISVDGGTGDNLPSASTVVTIKRYAP